VDEAAGSAVARAREARALPIVIGHRGAPGYLPEHTLAGYRLAVALGADSLEPDLVITGDGVLVLRHERDLSETTDVADRPAFSSRQRTTTIAGRTVTGWFVEDFTLAELKMLRAVERFPRVRPTSAASDGRHQVATFDEFLLLVAEASRATGREIGMHVELKQSTYFADLGLPLEPAVLNSLRDHGLDRRSGRVHVQSFEMTCLRSLSVSSDVRLVQLIAASGAPPDCVASGDPTTYDDLLSTQGLRMVSHHADAVGIAKDRLIGQDSQGVPEVSASRTIEDAHLEGLQVLSFTSRNENRFLADCYRGAGGPDEFGDVLGETRALFGLGVDGVFSDHPDTTVLAREDWLTRRRTAVSDWSGSRLEPRQGVSRG